MLNFWHYRTIKLELHKNLCYIFFIKFIREKNDEVLLQFKFFKNYFYGGHYFIPFYSENGILV